MLCCARLMFMPWSCYVHSILAENCLPSVSRRASRAERGERGITTYEAYRMVCVMFNLCSCHASPLHSKFTILSALPVQMLSQVFKSDVPCNYNTCFWGPPKMTLKPSFPDLQTYPQMDLKTNYFRLIFEAILKSILIRS